MQKQLFFFVTSDQPLASGGATVSVKDQEFRVSSATIDGLNVIAAFADPVAEHARNPGRGIAAIPLQEVLDWVLNGTPEGVVIYAGDEWLLLSATEIGALLDRAAQEPTATVPPDHSVTLISLGTRAAVNRTDFGVLIADFGATGDAAANTIEEVSRAQVAEAPSRTLWIVQAAASKRWAGQPASMESIFANLEDLVSGQPAGKHFAVVEPGTPASTEVTTRFNRLGVKVHRPSPDGVALIAVRFPDGRYDIGIAASEPSSTTAKRGPPISSIIAKGRLGMRPHSHNGGSA